MRRLSALLMEKYLKKGSARRALPFLTFRNCKDGGTHGF
jgi:hypothetical protein